MADNDVYVQSAGEMLANWLGNKRLTRRVIEAFPEQELFEFSVGGMRPFAELTHELLRISEPTVRGVATGTWGAFETGEMPSTKADLLRHWDESVAAVERLWPTIPASRFSEPDKAFGEHEATGYGSLQYAIENEIHHRAQGFVYLRALGIEPPPFYVR
jgi:uncharacterized damage-inducible protein DinB